MSCFEITVLWLSISVCRPDVLPQRLPGAWVGAVESGGERKPLRAALVRGRSGLTGVLRLEGAGDLRLLRAGESSSRVFLETGARGDEFVFVGVFREGSIVGHVDHAGEQWPFELHRTRGGWRGIR
jgi:hypothetical protein